MVIAMDNRTIDLANVRDVKDFQNIPKHLIYNDASVHLSSDLLHINPNLTPQEKEDAKFWKAFLNNIRGLMLVTGEPRSGKGIFMHMLAKKLNHYFGKLIITDTRPTEVFAYNTWNDDSITTTPIPFSFSMMLEQLDRINEVEKGIPRPYIIDDLVKADFADEESWKEYKELSVEDKYEEIVSRGLIVEDVRLQDYDSRKKQFITIPNMIPHVDNNGDWVSSRGKVFFRNSVLLLDELGTKDMPKSKWNINEAQALINFFNMWGHLHMLMLGVGVSTKDFNSVALEKANWEARCISADNQNRAYTTNPNDIVVIVNLYPVKYNPLSGELKTNNSEMIPLLVNGSEPRSWLGGKRIIDSFVTDNAQSSYVSASMRRKYQ